MPVQITTNKLKKSSYVGVFYARIMILDNPSFINEGISWQKTVLVLFKLSQSEYRIWIKDALGIKIKGIDN